MLNLTTDKIIDLTQNYGNAFYVLDSQQFQNNFRELKEQFKSIYSNFNIAYSYKTNYTPKLCKIVNKEGGYAEVVSEMELELAFRIGVAPNKIIWNGPIKNEEKVKELLFLGGTVNLDSIYEMNTIRQISSSYPDKIINLGVRCNFDVGDGVLSRFGFDIYSSEFKEILEFIRKEENIHLVNVQCHFAKRNIDYWPKRVKTMVEIVKRIENEIGYLPDRVDVGGGIYGKMQDELKKQFNFYIPTYNDYAETVASVFKEEFPNENIELIIEPGSALVGDCMTFVGRVETIKSIRGKFFATILGSQKNISMAGVNPPIKILKTGIERRAYESIDIVGYTCIEGDVLYHNYKGEIAVGDYVLFSNCGSYSIVMKPPFILPNFPVLDICDNNVEIIKRQESFDDIFNTYLL